jgi:transposase-like protein
VKRDLRMPILVTSDGTSGLSRAVDEILPNNLCQARVVRSTRNVTDKVADSGRAEVKGVMIGSRGLAKQERRRILGVSHIPSAAIEAAERIRHAQGYHK